MRESEDLQGASQVKAALRDEREAREAESAQTSNELSSRMSMSSTRMPIAGNDEGEDEHIFDKDANSNEEVTMGSRMSTSSAMLIAMRR